jgi:hypothetical protein
MIFDKQLISDIKETKYSLYHYGSSCTKYFNARDIDIISVSPEYKSPILRHFHIDNTTPPFNLYHVPEDVFIKDIIDLRYGGFFSHKFALSYRLIFQTDSSYDAPFYFWASEAMAYKDINGHFPTSKLLVLWTHFSIMSFNPTFGRSLSRYLFDNEAQFLLINQVTLILERLSKEGFPDLTISRNWRELLYRFFSTYQIFKNGNILWGNNTLSKISTSCLEYDTNVINNYFREEDLTSAFNGRAIARR